jgi:hypothetical protein
MCRLLQALNKATHFFENNLELLATIAQLKRESAAYLQTSRQHEEKLGGRIECLMEVVQQQQAKLDAQERVIALKGIWANLLLTSSPSSVGTGPGAAARLEEDCSAVITWLSLQCARDASRSGDDLLGGRGASPVREGSVMGAAISIHTLLDRIHDMTRRFEEVHSDLGKENAELRRVLQSNAARGEGDKRLIEELSSECGRLRVELEESLQKNRSALFLHHTHFFHNYQPIICDLWSHFSSTVTSMCDVT